MLLQLLQVQQHSRKGVVVVFPNKEGIKQRKGFDLLLLLLCGELYTPYTLFVVSRCCLFISKRYVCIDYLCAQCSVKTVKDKTTTIRNKHDMRETG
ncbi:MAG: hypothetical protein ACI8RD_009481 [Bacillariaceae sp.]|jgi:hypothetical protein